MIIYKATNKINGKLYIGQTKSSLGSRIASHLYSARSGKDSLPLLYRAIRKYGSQNFEWQIICECDDQTILDELEKKYIAEMHSTNTSIGYNIAEGGKGNNGTKGKTYEEIYGVEKALELRKKRSETLKGRERSESHRKNISSARTGIKHSEETKRKMSESRIGSLNSFYGKNHSEETKKIIGSKSVNRNWKRGATKCYII